jgi:hypothetical protein
VFSRSPRSSGWRPPERPRRPRRTRRSTGRFPTTYPSEGFWIDGEFDLERTTTTFYDEAGTALRTVSHIHADGTLSNPLTGKSIPDSGDFKVTVDLATGATTTEGRTNVATSPGDGIVYQVVGHLVLSSGDILFEAGPHDDADGTFDALCAYLAGP